MKILLIRHAHAVDEAPGLGDTGRWLTPKGRKVARKVARWIGKSHKRRPLAIWTSPLVRAVQTAEILAAGVDHEREVRACAELAPGHDPAEMLRRLTTEAMPAVIALVGHEPSLSLLGTALVGEPVPELKKGAVLGVDWTEGKGRRWMLLDPATMKAKKWSEEGEETAAAEPAAEG